MIKNFNYIKERKERNIHRFLIFYLTFNSSPAKSIPASNTSGIDSLGMSSLTFFILLDSGFVSASRTFNLKVAKEVIASESDSDIEPKDDVMNTTMKFLTFSIYLNAHVKNISKQIE